MKRPITDFSAGTALRRRAHALIPGGCHTYAKGDDQYPVLSPGHVVRGAGCRVWDADGNEYIEYGMGNRAVTLGHAHPAVIEAVRAQLGEGVSFTRPAAIEVEAAEAFLSLIDNAEMVKFSKDGSDATSGAVKIARAYTGRDLIAICADHPFFSVDDWFIGSTPIHGGIPDAVRRLTVKFRYNDIESVKALLAEHPGRVAGFILEAARVEPPRDDFLAELKRLAHADGALLVLDEMITGFRYHLQGAQRLYGIDPDLSTWGKALANGFSVSALAGKREFMRLGDLTQSDRPRVFLMSTTHGGETHGLAAAMATIDVYRREPVIEHLQRAGARLRAGVSEAAQRRGVQDYVSVIGADCNLLYATRDAALQPSQAFRTLFLQETIKRGVIMPSLVVSYAHTDADIDETIEAIDGALEVYTRALADGVEKYLVGPPSIPVYRTWNEKR
ncbi:MAG: glutamate-1-semialdehyde 2,1-aminomutase [Alphaproteobacteria bacterium]|nr:MAG: glutamate-1-semialdehyde 2,1-aminomutase [Alphaproteobacteria bacterium]